MPKTSSWISFRTRSEEQNDRLLDNPRDLCCGNILHDEAVMPISLPAIFGVLGANGKLFSVAGRADSVGRDSQCHQVIFSGLSPLRAEGKVVFTSSAFITMPFDLYLCSRRVL